MTEELFVSVLGVDRLEEIGRLRVKSWLHEGRLPAHVSKDSVWIDDLDRGKATHLGILDKNQIVAAARITVHNKITEVPEAEFYSVINSQILTPVASWNRLVVSPAYRGKNLGGKLDSFRFRLSMESDARSVLLWSPMPWRHNMIEKYGFQKYHFGISERFPGADIYVYHLELSHVRKADINSE